MIAESFSPRFVCDVFSGWQSCCARTMDRSVYMGMGRRGNRGPHKRRLQLDVEERKLPLKPCLQPDLLKDLKSLKDDPLMNEVVTIVRAADGRKAKDIRALRVSSLTTTAEFMLIMQVNNRIQNQAIATAIMDDMKEAHARSVIITTLLSFTLASCTDGDISSHRYNIYFTPQDRETAGRPRQWLGSG